MTIERLLRGIAGAMILLSLLLTLLYNEKWLYFTMFIGLNLLQSAFTNKCLMMSILKKAGFKNDCQCG